MIELLKNDKTVAYTLLRLTMGANMLAHGIIRIPKLEGFSSWMVEHFQSTFIPSFLVNGLAHAIPFVETIIGLLLIIGLFTRKTLNLGILLMAILVFGSCLTEKWEWVAFQMIYALFYFTLSYLNDMNRISVDHLVLSKK